MKPAAGERLQRFVGDSIRFALSDSSGQQVPKGWQARLRTSLGNGHLLCKEIIQAHAKKPLFAGASWHDLPMQASGAEWSLELPLVETGYFRAKPYFLDPDGWQHWPDGPDITISVHPNSCRTANTIYCAFTRMFGKSRTAISTKNEPQEAQFKELDAQGYTVIPPSGKFRDLIAQLPHIIDTLGCRILHLLPVNPTPTTMARYGRFGSPYASLGLTAVDPALVVFDRRTTGVDQFVELTYAAHLKGARVILDIVSNHTGWGSDLQEGHPEWFARAPDGSFVSPGAWGTIWEDLVELEHRHVPLWDYLGEVFLEWCRRGVDGFRCDAGYKVPLPAWQYITARVRQEFPETVFLLEGLGGPWAVTEQLLVEGGMQWAYSELFQNYSGAEVAAYLDYSLKSVGHTGLLVHYSETHDNDRLAARGRAWSLLRNRLCALASVSGGFGFTCGVEWLAPERINVHSSRGLAWDSHNNIVGELARLNSLLNGHPCFFENAALTRLSAPDSPVLALRRISGEGVDSVLVLVNNDDKLPQKFLLAPGAFADAGKLTFELAGSTPPKVKKAKDGAIEFTLEAAAAHCLSADPNPRGLSGEDYRQARAQAAWALTALGESLPVHKIPAFDWRDLARIVKENPAAMLAACFSADAETVRVRLESLRDGAASAVPPDYYAPVVVWELLDRRRILPVPQSHWLLVRDTAPFRASLTFDDGNPPLHVQSIAVDDGNVAFFCPRQPAGDAQLLIERYATTGAHVQAQIRFLGAEPDLASLKTGEVSPATDDLEQPLALLTNGIGGMARLCVDFGAIKSKYDCLLGANLHPRLPVDRHILAKRARVWINADGFISPLDIHNLVSFTPGPPAVWRFVANAGDGRTAEIQITAGMLPGRNTTVLLFSRPDGENRLDECDVRLTVRVDIEDRNFHSETKRNGGADYHFSTNSHAMTDRPGFAFTPASDRFLRVFAGGGTYHHESEWSENIPHPVEQSRGQTGSGDAYSPGWFDLPMPRDANVPLVVTADATDPSPEEIRKTFATPQENKPANADPAEDAFGQTLLKAARSFVVRRDEGVTVIAGYPWFLDWGRDSLICARGLLAAGMVDEVKQLLVAFGRFEKDGTLPNTIHGEDASNRDTSDAPLWYGVVCEEAAAVAGANLYQTPVDQTGRTIADVLSNIAVSYINGTPNAIHMDPDSALVWSPAHFTWMDTNYPACTPREGYPVEIQVLWIRLLRQMERIDRDSRRKRWHDLAEQASASLQKYFWLEQRGYFADLLAAKTGRPASEAVVENALRSNYLFAVSLGPVTGAQAKRCVEAALRYLVVPGALRTLAPLPVAPPLPIYAGNGQLLNNPVEPYWGHYEGDEDTRRKPAYHNGTAWTWTFPVFCEALARAWDFSAEAAAAARAYLGSMDRLIKEGCVGQVPEIVDGDAPHTQRGCDAQAWGVTEALRVWKVLHSSVENRHT
jgi:starch synthase (maltosyl-transferring)